MRHEALDQDLNNAVEVSRAELVAALSYALDLTEGQPEGHCIRAGWIGMNIGIAMRLTKAQLDDLYYSILLKDLGCSSNSARIAELYLTDDRSFKAGWKTVPTGLPATLRFIIDRTASGSSLPTRVRAVGNILRNGDRYAQEMIHARCTRGAEIAKRMHFNPSVARAIYYLDEHWDGSGRPERLRGRDIPLASRISLLAQVVDVFHQAGGRKAAMDEVMQREGGWFDPDLCATLSRVADDEAFWLALEDEHVDEYLAAIAPRDASENVDDDFLDDIAAAFGQVVDAKSPYTSGHSIRVAKYARAIAADLGFTEERQRFIYRGALLHDIGKLGVSSRILEKPGSLDETEWVEMRAHAEQTGNILSKVRVLKDMAPIAAAHHEKIDGSGYPLGLKDSDVSLETRIITICDFYDALTSDRPYRAAMRTEQALSIIEAEVDKAVDPTCFVALKRLVA